MIVLDIESSGLDSGRCGIWQIGSFELENPKNYFLQEGRIDDEDIIVEEALKITGKTEKELRDKKKQSQKQLILKYLDWRKSCKNKMNIGQNVGWDFNFLQNKCIRYGIMDKMCEVMGQRAIELHTIAQEIYKKIYGSYLLDEKGKSKMDLTCILKICGLPDERRQNINGKITGGQSHNALDDCKLEAECFSRLEYGKGIFQGYSKYKIPKELAK